MNFSKENIKLETFGTTPMIITVTLPRSDTDSREATVAAQVCLSERLALTKKVWIDVII